MRPSSIAVLLVVAVGGALLAQEKPPKGPFGVEGEEYWTSPWKNGADVTMRLVGERRFGLHVDAPAEVDPKKHDTLPVLFLYVATQRDAFKVDLTRHAKVVAVRLEDRSVAVGPAVALEAGKRPAPKLGADSDDSTSERHVVDAAKLGCLKTPGTYEVFLLLGAQRSRPLRVKVAGDAPAAPARLEPSADLVAAERVPATPKVPETAGLDLEVHGGLVAGAFRLRPLAGELAEKDPGAVIAVTLVAVGARSGEVTVTRLGVPVAGAKPEGEVTARFAAPRALVAPGKTVDTGSERRVIHAFAGEHVAPPVAIEVAAK